MATSPGGSLVAVGDEDGAVAVYNTWDGTCVFEDIKEGEEGPARAMRAMTFNNDNTILSCLAIDGKIRVYDIGRWERVTNWQGFGGESLEYNPEGDKMLAIDTLGQIKILDMVNHEQIDLEMVAWWCPSRAVCWWWALCRRHGPRGYCTALVTGGTDYQVIHCSRIQRHAEHRCKSRRHESCCNYPALHTHVFLPDLEPVGSDRHNAEEPTSAAFWTIEVLQSGERTD